MPVNAAILNLNEGYAGKCLRWVRLCLGAPALAATAWLAWLFSTTKHRGDRNPPPFVPVFFSAARTGRYAGAGHVAISLGGGWIKSTSWPSGSSIGVTGISNIERAWNRTYLGWTETLNGQRVYWPAAPAAPTATPQEEDDMFTDADRALLRQAALASNLPVLVRTRESPKVWLSNLVTRRLVDDVDQLALVQRSLAGRGLDSGVNFVASLDVFGVPVLTDADKSALTADQIAGLA
jgi:hypothetical protein